MGKTPKFEIIAGCYEEFLLGYYFYTTEDEIVQSFAAHDHSSSLKCVAFSGMYIASGGTDNQIFIYDMKSRQQKCMLTHHESTVNCLQFTPNGSHLLSGSNDGVLAVVRTGNWQVEKVWNKGHKGAAILDIAIHPTGKLALTLGADCTLSTWNLVKGRQAYVINLNSKCKDSKSIEKIVWCDDGVRFILYGGKYTEIWSIETGGILDCIEYNEKVTSCLWKSEDILIVGYENGDLARVNVEDHERKVVKAHGRRVKSVALYKKWIISISSCGEIKIWNKRLEEIARKDASCRLTCVCIALPIKTKTEEDDEETIQTYEVMDVDKSNDNKSRAKVTIEVEEEDEVKLPTIKNKKQKITNDAVKKTKKKKIK